MTSFDNFRFLDPEAADLARELVEASEQQRSVFSSFANVWMAFNGWMECVTQAETDAAMIGELAEHAKLVTAYEALLDDDPEFKEHILSLISLLPVLNVRDVRKKLGRDAFRKFNRIELMSEVQRATVKQQPVGWTNGAMLTWSQLLRTIYLVRCNLFHGSKSAENFRDHKLVVACDKILRRFISCAECFEWHD
ncbi:hypothetical protein K5D36_13420 [Pseudomonas cichorii]|nr:hypothetical protein [Pseudomonas cichorii]